MADLTARGVLFSRGVGGSGGLPRVQWVPRGRCRAQNGQNRVKMGPRWVQSGKSSRGVGGLGGSPPASTRIGPDSGSPRSRGPRSWGRGRGPRTCPAVSRALESGAGAPVTTVGDPPGGTHLNSRGPHPVLNGVPAIAGTPYPAWAGPSHWGRLNGRH